MNIKIDKRLIDRVCCPLCGSTSTKTLYQMDYSNVELVDYFSRFYQGSADLEVANENVYIIKMCSVCKLVYQKWVPNDELAKDIYGSWICAETSKAYEIDNIVRLKNSWRRELKLLDRILDGPKNDVKFYDFGMGWGTFAKEAKNYGFNAFGSELSDERIKYCSKLGINNKPIEDIQNGSLDIINLEQVLEHINEPFDLLSCLIEKLRLGGVLRISIPYKCNGIHNPINPDWKVGSGRSKYNCIAPLEHVNYFNTETMEFFEKILPVHKIKYKKIMLVELQISVLKGNFMRNAFDITKKLASSISYFRKI